MRRLGGLIVVLAVFAGLPAEASAASWFWWRTFDATLSVTQTATWTTTSARPCGLSGQGQWVFDARPATPTRVEVQFLGGGYVTKGEGGYRVFDVGRRYHSALPASGTATAAVTQQPSDDPTAPCDEVPNLSQCGTRTFPRRYTGGSLLGRPRVGRMTLHIEAIPDPDELPGSGEIPCLRIDPRLPGAGFQLDLVGTDLPVKRVFRRRTVTFRGERSYREREYGVDVGGISVSARLKTVLAWELTLRAAGRARQQCSYETRRNRCPRL
jgi:hypothetical protein